MAKAAPDIAVPSADRRLHEYEQPLTERMRTFMRLEFLYQQMLFNAEQEADWATRAATTVAPLLPLDVDAGPEGDDMQADGDR